MELLKILELIIHNVIHYGPTVITLASAISAVTPVPDSTHRVLGIFSNVIDILALNVGKAKKQPNNSKTPEAKE